MTTPAFGIPVGHVTDPAGYFLRTERALGHRYQPEQIVAVSSERILFRARDLTLKRQVSLRVNFESGADIRAWFMREAEALAQLNHPAIRHIYDAGVAGELAYRVGTWIEGEGLDEASRRGPRLIPMVHTLARDLLGALEHAHMNGIILRRIVPASLLLSHAGRGTVTDARFSSHTLPAVPPGTPVTGQAFMAPEVRDGSVGDPASDVYTAGAILYFALTGVEPPLDSRRIKRPTELRPTTPRAMERVVLRALNPVPDDRYLNAIEMLEDFTSDAGTFETVAVAPSTRGILTEDGPHWEQRLRRALGDDYELLDKLGTGGFGRVYRVRDLHLEREVALKVLHPQFTQDPAVVERFRREAQLAARLNHVNIVNIFDIGGRSGLSWYTMELIDGPSLAQLVEKEGPLSLPKTLRLMREALSALGHAHSAGLIHRDIKPGNLWLRLPLVGGEPFDPERHRDPAVAPVLSTVVIDFGMVRAAKVAPEVGGRFVAGTAGDLKPENMLIERDGGLRITDFGLALALRGAGKYGGATSQSGTPQFASPEQLLGERVDQRTDLYSLAAVATFALLGRPPFPGNTPEQILSRQSTNQLPDITAERSDVPEAVSDVLCRALDAEPGNRFASAAEFLQALNRATGGRRERDRAEWARTAARWLGLPPPSGD